MLGRKELECEAFSLKPSGKFGVFSAASVVFSGLSRGIPGVLCSEICPVLSCVHQGLWLFLFGSEL